MPMPSDYQVHEQDAAYLRTCFGLRPQPGEDPPELPELVKRIHYYMSHCVTMLGDRAPNGGLKPAHLAAVATLVLVLGDEPRKAEPTNEFPGTDYGRKVVIHYRKRDRPAHFLRREEDRVVVLCEGNERNIRPDLVRFPREGEFPDVAETLKSQDSQ